MSTIRIWGTISVQVDQVDLEQYLIEHPKSSALDLDLQASLAATGMEDFISFQNQLNKFNQLLRFMHTRRNKHAAGMVNGERSYSEDAWPLIVTFGIRSRTPEETAQESTLEAEHVD